MRTTISLSGKLLTALLVAAGMSCTDTSGPESHETMTISGRFADWTLGDSMVIQAIRNPLSSLNVVLAQAPVADDGSFVLTMGPAADDLLVEYAWYYNDIIVEDTARNYLWATFRISPVHQTAGGIEAWTTRTPFCSSSAESCMSIRYDYFKRPWRYSAHTLNVTGHDTVQVIIVFNYHAGWNKLIYVRTSLGAHKVVYKAYVDNSLQAPWYAFGIRDQVPGAPGRRPVRDAGGLFSMPGDCGVPPGE